MKRLLFLAIVLLASLFLVPQTTYAAGFNEFGYNYGARIFNGTGMSWCEGKYSIYDKSECESALGGPFTNDKLVMKWSKAWDNARFHGAPWTPDAWEDNEWNGNTPGGTKAVWHYKIAWVGPELENSSYWRQGGYPIWGEFEVLMDQGTDKNGVYLQCDPNNGGHSICTLAQPNGYGSY